MRLSLIHEATVQDVERRIPIWIDKYFREHKTISSDIISHAAESDPTKGKYTEWVIKQWKSGNVGLPSDIEFIKDLLTKFDKIKHRLESKDINSYTVKDLEDKLETLVDTKSSKKKVDIDLYGVEVVEQNGIYTTLRVSDEDALAKLGIGTKWCTRGDHPDCEASNYIKDHDIIYVVLENGHPIMQYTPDYVEIHDINNDEVTDPKLLDLLIEPPLNGDSYAIYNYALEIIKGRWPEGEKALLRSGKSLVAYARDVVKGRWPEAEEIIIKNPYLSYHYAKDVIKGRWPEAEETMSKDREMKNIYTRFINSLK